MQTENRIVIEASWARVFDAAAQVEDWPDFLDHYRWVRTGPWSGAEREVRMSASRSGFPCWWSARQRLERAKKRIHYLHTRSAFTQGMDVWWLLKALGPRSTEVRLTHAMPPSGRPKAWFRGHVVGSFFVHAIAEKTLAGVKRHLEGAK
jgi:ribosome-associated toxin RatA of RatAB toxin-antitoxin module